MIALVYIKAGNLNNVLYNPGNPDNSGMDNRNPDGTTWCPSGELIMILDADMQVGTRGKMFCRNPDAGARGANVCLC